MANTFTMIGPSGVFPGQAQPLLPSYPSVNAPSIPPPGTNGSGGVEIFTPVKPLPGLLGPSSVPI